MSNAPRADANATSAPPVANPMICMTPTDMLNIDRPRT
jgi:hypothetical protein